MALERRNTGIRRDLNNLVRDESGNISGSKLGTYVGQFIAAKLLLVHSEYIIERWDSLSVLFLVLIAPEAYKKFLQWKTNADGNRDSASFSRTTDTHIEENKKVKNDDVSTERVVSPPQVAG